MTESITEQEMILNLKTAGYDATLIQLRKKDTEKSAQASMSDT